MRIPKLTLTIPAVLAMTGAMTGAATGTAAAGDTVTYSAGHLPDGCDARVYPAFTEHGDTLWGGVAYCSGPLPQGHREYALLLGCPSWNVRDAQGTWQQTGGAESLARCGNAEKPDRIRIRTRPGRR